MVDVTSKYEVELSAEEQQQLNQGESVDIELPDATVELTAAMDGSLSSRVDPDSRDVQADEDVSMEDLEAEMVQAQEEDAPVELKGGEGGGAKTGLITKNPSEGDEGN